MRRTIQVVHDVPESVARAIDLIAARERRQPGEVVTEALEAYTLERQVRLDWPTAGTAFELWENEVDGLYDAP